jgi:hypothetical protein
MTAEQLRFRLGRERAWQLLPRSAGEAGLLSKANRQAGEGADPATDIAARTQRALDGA